MAAVGSDRRVDSDGAGCSESAGIAGVPIQYGLHAAAAGAILYAIFGTSRQISTGPSSALTAISGRAVIVAGLSSTEGTVVLVAAITFVTGILFLLLVSFKMGWISQFLSKAVVTGFLFGAAIEVVIGEMPKITGTSTEIENAWLELERLHASDEGRNSRRLAALPGAATGRLTRRAVKTF